MIEKSCTVPAKDGNNKVVTNNHSGVRGLKFVVVREHITKSTKYTNVLRNISIIRSMLASGATVREDNPCLSAGRYRKDIVRAMRQTHRIYNSITTLELVGGLWVIAPIPNDVLTQGMEDETAEINKHRGVRG